MKNQLTLAKWLELKNKTISDVATDLGVSRQHINSIKNAQPAGRKLAWKIWQYTDHNVSLISLLYPRK